MPAAKEIIGQIEYYSRAMKAPRIREAATRLANQAREGGWTHEEYLAAVLSREVAAREASGAEIRARAAGFPARKSLEDFNFDHQPGLKRDMAFGLNTDPSSPAHLATGAFLTEASNIVLLGPPGIGKTHLATGLGLRATQLGHRVLFATAIDWVARLQAAHQNGRLPQELVRLRRYGLIIVDEVGYIPFEQDAANLFFQLVSSRYEHASLILTSNLPFARWGDVFGDQVVAPAMIDRIVHHAEVITLKGSSYRLKHTQIDSLPSTRPEIRQNNQRQSGSLFSPAKWLTFRPSLTLRGGLRRTPLGGIPRSAQSSEAAMRKVDAGCAWLRVLVTPAARHLRCPDGVLRLSA